jgi:hypothetical protein
MKPKYCNCSQRIDRGGASSCCLPEDKRFMIVVKSLLINSNSSTDYNLSPAKVRKNVVALRKRLSSFIRGETKDVDGDVEMKDWETNLAFISTPRQIRV